MKQNALLFIVLLMIIPVIGLSQNERAQLEEDKKKLEEDIHYTNKLLDQTKKSRQSSLNEVYILTDKINKRQELIVTIDREIYFINLQINQVNDSIEILTENLEKLKEEYASLIYFAYKNKNLYNRMMFIFASDDFNQAYQRLKYFQQYNAYRHKQAELILETQESLREKNERLKEDKAEKEDLRVRQGNEKDQLLAEKNQKDSRVQELSKKEKELKKALKQKEKAAKELQKAIEDIIAEEIRLANERAKANADKSKGMALTPEELLISDNFMNNKGMLPWPLERGVISETFGEHPHPVLTKVKVKNNGINILTDEGAQARTVFDGEVTRVLSVPNYNNVVIVRHGEYLTVYSNLDQVLVQQGEMVTIKQAIGTVFTNPDKTKTELHFEVWKAKTLLNPALWIAKSK